MNENPQLDAFSVDVRNLLERSVANLYSHLVTRPTGRAVRLAIESQLEEIRGPALSLVDLSSVSILDFSCADEVVAKLLLRALEDEDWSRTFFIFRGVQEHHVEPIEAVLERHGLVAVAGVGGEVYRLLGAGSQVERAVWIEVETRGRIRAEEVGELFPEAEALATVERLVGRRALFRHPLRGDLHALSHLARELE